MLNLKQYQKNTLERLQQYLDKARLSDPLAAFIATQQAIGYSKNYRPVPHLDATPFVCLRLPTGGGKTLLAAHTVPVAARHYMDQDYPLVLWMVPRDIIRQQAIQTLNDPRHPNRQVLDAAFDGNVRVLDVADFELLGPQDLGNKAVVIVSTFAALRVRDKTGRRVYSHNEAFEPHFSRLKSSAAWLDRSSEGQVLLSFANLVKHHRPLMIVDEAHNLKGKLADDVLKDLRPSVIIEYTATPDKDSNVLYSVSAAELKAESMIKLPVILTEHRSWQDAVASSIQTRQQLEAATEKEPRALRPILLLQAENRDLEVNVEVLRNHLIEQEHIPADQIAVATGDEHGIEDLDLFSSQCPIRYIITVQALREGWDCSYAYVLCSVSTVRSSTAAEQLLGRVLRMPGALAFQSRELNRAYAHVVVSHWNEAVGMVRDGLIQMGFDKVEAEISVVQTTLIEEDDAKIWVEPRQVSFIVAEEPTMDGIDLALRGFMNIEQQAENEYHVTVQVQSKADLQAIEAQVPSMFRRIEDRHAAITAVSQASGSVRTLTSSERNETIEVPQLCLDFGDGDSAVASREAFLPDGWNPLDCAAGLDGFNVDEENHVFEIDVDGDKVKQRSLPGTEELQGDGTAGYWNEVRLIAWFDRQLRQDDLQSPQLIAFLRREINHLLTARRVRFVDLVRLRFLLAKLLQQKIRTVRDKAYQNAVQTLFRDHPAMFKTSPEAIRVFQAGVYPVKRKYSGNWRFNKHFFPLIGGMDNPEEEACAVALDANKSVYTWVRNISGEPQTSFWLQTSTDRFYPDFVAKLTDGRILIVEYKGTGWLSMTDSDEKAIIGQVWAQQSGNLFLMATKKDAAGRDVTAQISGIIR